MSVLENIPRLADYIEAFSRGDLASLEELLHAEATLIEFDSRRSPSGATRQRDEVLALSKRWAEAMGAAAAPRIDNILALGPQAAAEIVWTAKLAAELWDLPVGTEVSVFMGLLVEFQEDRVHAQRMYTSVALTR